MPENTNIKVHPLDIRGTEVEVFVTYNGGWTASLDGTNYSGDSRDDLRERLMQASRKKAVKVEVPFSLLSSNGTWRQGPVSYDITNGLATGIHQGTRKVLVKLSRYGRMVSEQWEGNSNNTFRPLTSEEGERLMALAQARDEADRAYSEYSRTLSLDLRQAVAKAVEEAQAKLGQDEAAGPAHLESD